MKISINKDLKFTLVDVFFFLLRRGKIIKDMNTKLRLQLTKKTPDVVDEMFIFFNK